MGNVPYQLIEEVKVVAESSEDSGGMRRWCDDLICRRVTTHGETSYTKSCFSSATIPRSILQGSFLNSSMYLRQHHLYISCLCAQSKREHLGHP